MAGGRYHGSKSDAVGPRRPDNGKRIPLPDKATVTLGRESDNDIVADTLRVSRRHAAIRDDPSGFWLEDPGSRNGTFVNRELLEDEETWLQDQDAIALGGADSPVQWAFKDLGGTLIMQRPR